MKPIRIWLHGNSLKNLEHTWYEAPQMSSRLCARIPDWTNIREVPGYPGVPINNVIATVPAMCYLSFSWSDLNSIDGSNRLCVVPFNAGKNLWSGANETHALEIRQYRNCPTCGLKLDGDLYKQHMFCRSCSRNWPGGNFIAPRTHNEAVLSGRYACREKVALWDATEFPSLSAARSVGFEPNPTLVFSVFRQTNPNLGRWDKDNGSWMGDEAPKFIIDPTQTKIPFWEEKPEVTSDAEIRPMFLRETGLSFNSNRNFINPFSEDTEPFRDGAQFELDQVHLLHLVSKESFRYIIGEAKQRWV